MNEFELTKEKIDSDILIAISGVGSKNVYKSFHTLIEGDLSDETCNKIIKHYKDIGWESAECKSSKTINEETKDEYNPDRRYNRTGVLLTNFTTKIINHTQQ
jgi:hypothetical protein